jgi:hypothetical protein
VLRAAGREEVSTPVLEFSIALLPCCSCSGRLERDGRTGVEGGVKLDPGSDYSLESFPGSSRAPCR